MQYVALFVLLLAVTGNATPLSGERCNSAKDPVKVNRLAGEVGSWNVSMQMSSASTGCHYHPFVKEELLEPDGCLGGSHVMMYGGSVGTGVAVGLLQLLNPAEEYPIDPNEYVNVRDGDIMSHFSGAVTFIHAVFNAEGELLSIISFLEKDIDDSLGNLVEGTLDQFTRVIRDAPDPGPGGIRFTFTRTRYYKVLAVLSKAYKDAADSGNKAQLSTLIFSGLRHWWYQFCVNNDPLNRFCERTDLDDRPEVEISAVAKSEFQTFLRGVESEIPDVKMVAVGNERYSFWFRSVLSQVISSTTNIVVELINEESPEYVNFDYTAEYIYDSHPMVMLNILTAQRIANVFCTEAGMYGTGDNPVINFDSPGCTLADRNEGRETPEAWGMQYYQPCNFTRSIDNVDYNYTKPLPDLTCMSLGESCITNDDCCNPGCDTETKTCKRIQVAASSELSLSSISGVFQRSASEAEHFFSYGTSEPGYLLPKFWYHYMMSAIAGVVIFCAAIYTYKYDWLMGVMELLGCHHEDTNLNTSATASAVNRSSAAAPGARGGASQRSQSTKLSRTPSMPFNGRRAQSTKLPRSGSIVKNGSITTYNPQNPTNQEVTTKKAQRHSTNTVSSDSSSVSSDAEDIEVGNPQMPKMGLKPTMSFMSFMPTDLPAASTPNKQPAMRNSVRRTLRSTRSMDLTPRDSSGQVPLSRLKPEAEDNDQPVMALPVASTKSDRSVPKAQTVGEASEVTPQTTKPKKSAQLHALGFARYFASVHIVVGHVSRKNPSPIAAFPSNNWGFIWVPWFMMLSGFILTYARLASRNPDKLEPWYRFTFKRMLSIYPLYLVGLLTMMFIDSIQGSTPLTLDPALKPETQGAGVASLFLLQAWNPFWTEHVYQSHCWFLSCIIPYWATHNVMYRLIKRLSTTMLFVLGAFLTMVPPILLWVIPPVMGLDYGWSSHEFRAIAPVDILVVVLKFNPLSYWAVYLFGMVCGNLFLRFRDDPPFVFRYGATIGYLVMYLVFLTGSDKTLPASSLTCRLGALAPLQALTLIGLSMGEDPLSKLFGHKWLQPFGNISYPQYVYQFIAYTLWGSARLHFGFWLVLNALAIGGYQFVQKPLRNINMTWKDRRHGLYGSVVMIAVVVGAFALSFPHVEQLRLDKRTAPQHFVYTDTAFDMRLDVPFDESSSTFKPLGNRYGPSDYYTINPSVTMVNKDLFVSFRRHRYAESSGDVDYRDPASGLIVSVFEEAVTWYSDALVGRLNFTESTNSIAVEDPQLVMMEGGNGPDLWNVCQRESLYIPQNRTLISVFSYGFEDPRIAPSTTQGASATSLSITVNSLPLLGDSENGVCDKEVRMFMSGVDAASGNLTTSVDEMVLEDDVATSPQKNWIAVQGNSVGYFIQSLDPFVVVRKDLNDGLFKVVYQTVSDAIENTNKAFQALASAYPVDSAERTHYSKGLAFHGGSNAVLFDEEDIQRSDNATVKPFLLGMIHSVNSRRQYVNYLVRLETSPPFDIIDISEPVPLVMGPLVDGSLQQRMAFGAGIVKLLDGRIMISYGSSNIESRVLVLGRAELNSLFQDSLFADVSLQEIPTVPTASPTHRPTASPSPAPTLGPRVGLGERCEEFGTPCYPGLTCVVVRSNDNLNQCKNCEKFEDSCPFWTNAAFLEAAEEACGMTCPTPSPTLFPTVSPTNSPTTPAPTVSPTTPAPTVSPTKSPTGQPTTSEPTTSSPTVSPTVFPTESPTSFPTDSPTKAPTAEVAT